MIVARKDQTTSTLKATEVILEKSLKDLGFDKHFERAALIDLIRHARHTLYNEDVKYLRIISEYNTYEDDKYQQQLIINYTEEGLLMLKRHSHGGFEELNINNL